MTVLDHDWFPGALPDNVDLGDGTWLHSAYAFLHYRSRRRTGLRVGRRCGLYIGTMFNLGPDAEMTVGDYTILGGVVVSTNGRVVIGSHSLLSYEVVMAGHGYAVPPGVVHAGVVHAAQQVRRHDAPIVIGDDAWVGARAVLLAGAVIGRGAIVGTGTVVAGTVADYAIVAGNPPRVVGEAAPGPAQGGAGSASNNNLESPPAS